AELDAVVDIAHELGRSRGVFGARMTGGGFGGSAIILVESAQLESIQRHIADAYRRQAGREASFLVSRAGGAANVETRTRARRRTSPQPPARSRTPRDRDPA